MVDSSEKVSFRVDMQCSSVRAEAFLVFDRGSQPTLGQQITDMLPTVGRQTANSWQKIFVKGGKQQSADSFFGELFFTFSVLTKFNTYHDSICSSWSGECRCTCLVQEQKCPSLLWIQ